MRFLILEEDSLARTRMIAALREQSNEYEFLEIARPEDFQTALSRPNFDLVITDYQLSWTSGLEILKRIRERHIHLPVIMVTEALCETVAMEGRKWGLSDYLLKHHFNLLPLAVGDALQRATLQSEHARAIRPLETCEERYRVAAELPTPGVNSDLNDLQRAEFVLRQSKQEYEALVDSIDGIVWEADPGTLGFTYVSRQAERILGFPIATWIHQPAFLAEHIHADDREWVLRDIYAAVADQRRHELEYRMYAADGRTVWLRQLGSLGIDDERVAKLRGVMFDVTARKQAVEQLQLSENHLRTIINAEPECVKTLDRDGILLDMNPAGLAIIEAPSRGHVIGQPMLPMVVPEYRDAFQALVTDVFDGKERALEFEILTLNGHRRWLATRAVPLRDPRNEVTALLSITRDITEQRQAQAALQASEDRYRKLFENANDAMFTLDLEGNFTSVNKAGERILGYPRDEILKMDISHFLMPADLSRARQIPSRAGFGTIAITDEFEVLVKGGCRVALDIGLQPILHEGTLVGIQGLARDVTERKRLESQLRHAQRMESIDTLAGGMAHDFNNILTGIIGYCDLAMRDLSLDHPHYKSLREIQKLGERAANLTRQLLTFARKQALEPRPIHINAVLADLSQFIQRVLGENIVFRVITRGDLAQIHADVTQIEQVLMNLCINARDAMPQGGTLLIEAQDVKLDESFCTNHPWAKPGDYLQISITDTGTGIDRNTQERIFDPFFTTKEPGRGTGLGLAIVYSIIQQHRGMIEVQSAIGRGTTFRIYLPVQAGVALVTEADDVQTLQDGKETLLVVEDEAVIRDLMVGVLREQGYQMLTAANGNEALQVLLEKLALVNLVVSDAVMPGVGGRELYEILKSHKPSLRLLFISGNKIQMLRESFESTEGLDFLEKPFKPSELTQKVRQLLDRPHRARWGQTGRGE
ncbi:MAG: PAS domain S-box protein [Acidobacteria bacterium]|nr:PAS domain S-box protein [Acidobacteriota bacterium]MBI3655730.1 PAS domain S-box protein [Acidobacteriota bacterium]